MDVPDFVVYICIICAMLALLTLLYINFGKLSVEKMSTVTRDSRSVEATSESKGYVHDDINPDNVIPRAVEIRDVKPYQYQSYVASDDSLCADGNQPLDDGQCPGVVGNRVPVVFFKLPSVEPVVLGAGTVMKDLKITPEQSKLILDNVTKYVASKAGDTPDDKFVRDLYIDAFANVLADVTPGSNKIETMKSISNVRKSNPKAVVAKTGRVINQRKLKEHFEVAPSAADAAKMIATETDVKKRIAFETTQYDNGAQPGDSCNNSTSVYENILNGCYSSRFPVVAGVEKNKPYSYADSIVNTTFPGDMCPDGTIADEYGCFGGIRPPEISLETKRNFNVYTGHKQQYDFCPNNEFLPEIDTCKTVSEQEDFIRFKQDLDDNKKHLYDVLFPGPRKPFDKTNKYVANCNERVGICTLDPSWL